MKGFQTGVRVGFHCAEYTPDNPRPDAWCDACESRFQAAGGNWEGEPEEKADIKILCGSCYDEAKRFHLAVA